MKSIKVGYMIVNEVASKILYTEHKGKIQELNLMKGFLKRMCVEYEKLEDKQSRERPEENEPDFIVHLKNKKRLGFEFTFYYSDQSRGTFEKWSKISNIIKDKLLKSGNGQEYLYGAIQFKGPYSSLNGIDKEKFADECVAVTKHLISETKLRQKSFFFNDFTQFPYLATYVDQIHFNNTFPEKGILWWHGSLQSGFVDDPTPILPKIIDGKNKKNYKKDNLHSLSLLICASALTLGDTGVTIDLEKLPKIDYSPFDKIFYWDKFLENIFEIYPMRKLIFDGEKLKCV